jgi:hypothetical protein
MNLSSLQHARLRCSDFTLVGLTINSVFLGVQFIQADFFHVSYFQLKTPFSVDLFFFSNKTNLQEFKDEKALTFIIER